MKQFLGFFLLSSMLVACGGHYTDPTTGAAQTNLHPQGSVQNAVGNSFNLDPSSPQNSSPNMTLGNGSSSENAQPQVPPPFANIEAAKNGKLECENTSDCLQSVALISIPNQNGVARCSGVLVASDLVLTNDHCVKNAVVPYVYVHLVGKETLSVSKILFRSYEKGPDTPDYALLQLSTRVTDRDPAPLAQRGFQNTELANIYRVQMTSSATGQMNGLQTRLICRANHHTMLYPGVQDSRAPVMTFGDCPIESGNSGSPAFNSKGELTAVIQGYYLLKDRPDVSSELNRYALDQDFGKVGVGTQVMCMSPLNARASSQCAPWVKAEGMMPSSYVSQYGSVPLFSGVTRPDERSALQWRRSDRDISDQTLLYIQTPRCVFASETTPQSYAVKKYRRGISRAYVIEWREEVLNQEGRDTFDVISKDTYQAKMRSDLGIEVTIPLCRE